MKTMAIIKNGLVVNCVVWDETREWNPGEEFTVVDITGMHGVGIGSLYIDGVFSRRVTEVKMNLISGESVVIRPYFGRVDARGWTDGPVYTVSDEGFGTLNTDPEGAFTTLNTEGGSLGECWVRVQGTYGEDVVDQYCYITVVGADVNNVTLEVQRD